MREPADASGWLGQRRGDEHVVALEEGRHVASIGVDGGERVDIVRAGHAFRIAAGIAHDVLDIVLAKVAAEARQLRTNARGRAGGDHLGPRHHHGLRVGATGICIGPRLLDHVAEVFQQLRRVGRGLGAVRMDGIARQRRRAERHAQAGARMHRLGKRCLQGRGDVGRARIRPGAGVQQGGRVAHGAGQEPVDGHASPAFPGIRSVRQPRARRLEAEQAAGRGRDAHRPAAIRPVRRRHDARRHRRARAARRAAGRTAGVPRIARRSVIDRGFCHCTDAQLGRGRAAERDQPGFVQPLDQCAVALMRRTLEQARAGGHGKVRGLRPQILQKERHALERPARQACLDVGTGDVLAHAHDRIEGRVQRLDPC